MDCINTIRVTFDYAAMADHEELWTDTSYLTGEKTNRFCHIRRTSEDLQRNRI